VRAGLAGREGARRETRGEGEGGREVRGRSRSRERGGHGVRFSDKISNLKFHRNFTILGSKLIVLSTGTLRPSPSTVSGPIATP